MADASIINKYSDLTLFIIRAGLLDRNLLVDVEKFHTERKYGNMSLILNGTDGGGNNIIRPDNQQISVLEHIPGDNYSLPVSSILSQ